MAAPSIEEAEMSDDQFAGLQRDLKVHRWMLAVAMVLTYIHLLQVVVLCE